METLTENQLTQFIHEGYVKLDNAFPRDVADECRKILWKATQCDPDDPKTWTQPVIRIEELGLESFKQAANTILRSERL